MKNQYLWLILAAVVLYMFYKSTTNSAAAQANAVDAGYASTAAGVIEDVF